MDVASLDPWQNLGTICLPMSRLFTFRSNISGVDRSHNCHHATIFLQLISLVLKHLGILKKIPLITPSVDGFILIDDFVLILPRFHSNS